MSLFFLKLKPKLGQILRCLLHLISAGVVLYCLKLSAHAYQELLALSQTLECFCPSCPETAVNSKNMSTLGLIKVEVAGAVKKPGVYQLEIGQRMADLIEQAGGFKNTVAKSYLAKEINLAVELEDQSKVYIPFEEELQLQAKVSQTTQVKSDEKSDNNQGKTSINSASQKELEALPEIGAKRAEEILAGRPYSQLTDLLDQEILTENLFNKIKELISL